MPHFCGGLLDYGPRGRGPLHDFGGGLLAADC